jgi:hypothetical protein
MASTSLTTPPTGRQRVVMIHRGTLGAMERVVIALLEHYQGRLPLCLAPVQIWVMTVGAGQDEPARALLDDLGAEGLGARPGKSGRLGDARRPVEPNTRAYRWRIVLRRGARSPGRGCHDLDHATKAGRSGQSDVSGHQDRVELLG